MTRTGKIRAAVMGIALVAVLAVGCVEGPDAVLCEYRGVTQDRHSDDDSLYAIRVKGRYLTHPGLICGEHALAEYSGNWRDAQEANARLDAVASRQRD